MLLYTHLRFALENCLPTTPSLSSRGISTVLTTIFVVTLFDWMTAMHVCKDGRMGTRRRKRTQLSISGFRPCIGVMQSLRKLCAAAALNQFSFLNTERVSEQTDRLTQCWRRRWAYVFGFLDVRQL
ncbi:hypothetical protein BU25DRAFT_407346 [Macroventuria anomochaeta]|uniref:Uncharacterized protein n=1 Tax=Macroventuria anomochaeta TaxID=301207 RepID=A0ACB6SBL5_9PLEO|nr:uncharacterized protein BU25DRAFT_407346 [Macroventuria anomochaeta]KAF2631701.1 hypothetical protein BU25DRAFT_407346 [Macroventuria anomochaeta]